jgi:hypothetical protein
VKPTPVPVFNIAAMAKGGYQLWLKRPAAAPLAGGRSCCNLYDTGLMNPAHVEASTRLALLSSVAGGQRLEGGV